jgi:hypothetical protein
MRLGSEGDGGSGKMRRRRGRRLLIMRRLLLLRCLLCGLLRCCFLRCHESSTPLRCQTVNQYMCGIAEFGQRVKFCFLDFPGRNGYRIVKTDRTAKESPASPSLAIGQTHLIGSFLRTRYKRRVRYNRSAFLTSSIGISRHAPDGRSSSLKGPY